MKIECGKVLIRTAEDADAEMLCKWWNDGGVMAHAGFPNGLSISMDEAIALVKQHGGNTWLIIEIEGTSIGEMCFFINSDTTADIGIKICETDLRERGYGSLCLKMLIYYLFNKIGICKIFVSTNVKNSRAQHVYEKIGFRKTAP